jgi:hypothetical protein
MRLQSILVAAALLLISSAAAAQTIYKYRGADGKITYSNRLIPGAELVEAFQYKYAAPAPREATATKSEAASEERIKKHLAALEAAWTEVREATTALAVAEARLKAGDAPLQDEGTSVGGAATPLPASEGGPKAGEAEPGVLSPAAPEVGGRQAPAPQAVGGPQPIAPPSKGQTVAQAAAASRAIGGPFGTRGGGGRNAEYRERLAGLESDVRVARERLDAALRNYNQLR